MSSIYTESKIIGKDSVTTEVEFDYAEITVDDDITVCVEITNVGVEIYFVVNAICRPLVAGDRIVITDLDDKKIPSYPLVHERIHVQNKNDI